MPALSIVVPVYNAEKYIDRCLNSISAQTFSDYEVILVNDGSTDGSLEKCREYARTNPNVRVIDKPNEGSGPTRTRGMLEAQGEYLFFPDADDWFEPNMCERLYSLAKQNNADMVFSGINHYHKETDDRLTLHHKSICNPVNFRTSEECRQGVMALFPTTTIFDVPWNKLYRRATAIENHLCFRPLRRCQDAVFNLDFYNCSRQVVSTSEAFYNYMENNSADVARKFPKDYSDIIIFYNRHLKELFIEWGMFEGDVRVHFDTSFVLGIYSALGMCESCQWEMGRNQKREYVGAILNNEYVRKRISDAWIHPDCKAIHELISQRDVSAVCHALRKEKIMNVLRNNKLYLAIRCKMKSLKLK